MLEPEGDVIGIGSGGNYALAAGKVLMDTVIYQQKKLQKKLLKVAADNLCFYE